MINILQLSTSFVLLFFFITTTLQAQYDFNNLTPYGQEVYDFIQNNRELNDELNLGLNELKSARILGYTTLGLIGTGLVTFGSAIHNITNSSFDILAPIAIVSLITASATGLRGIFKRKRGKKRIENLLQYAEGAVSRKYQGNLELNSTPNGFGLVFSF